MSCSPGGFVFSLRVRSLAHGKVLVACGGQVCYPESPHWLERIWPACRGVAQPG